MSVGCFLANACCCSSLAFRPTAWTVAVSRLGLAGGAAVVVGDAVVLAAGEGVALVVAAGDGFAALGEPFLPTSAATPTTAMMMTRTIAAAPGMVPAPRFGRPSVFASPSFRLSLMRFACESYRPRAAR